MDRFQPPMPSEEQPNSFYGDEDQHDPYLCSDCGENPGTHETDKGEYVCLDCYTDLFDQAEVLSE